MLNASSSFFRRCREAKCKEFWCYDEVSINFKMSKRPLKVKLSPHFKSTDVWIKMAHGAAVGSSKDGKWLIHLGFPSF